MNYMKNKQYIVPNPLQTIFYPRKPIDERFIAQSAMCRFKDEQHCHINIYLPLWIGVCVLEMFFGRQ